MNLGIPPPLLTRVGTLYLGNYRTTLSASSRLGVVSCAAKRNEASGVSIDWRETRGCGGIYQYIPQRAE